MKFFIKFLNFVLLILFASCFLFSCVNKIKADNAPIETTDETIKIDENNKSEENNEKIKVVTTIFPIYDIVRNLVPNDKYKLTLLLDNGIDIHNFQPTANDILTVADSDLFIYIGGESDDWVDKVVLTSQNKNLNTLNLMESLSHLVKKEEIIEGMENEHDHDEEHEENHDEKHDEQREEHDENHEHEIENDEHIWLSLRNAKELTQVIADKLSSIDKDNSITIQKNSSLFIEKLDTLDKKYNDFVNTAKTKTLLFADRFPFRYMADDYKLTYFAAFSGCSAEAEASFETVAFLAKKIDELDLKHICAVTGSNHKIPETVRNTTKNKNQDIIYFNSMERVTDINDQENINYINIMEENLSSLEKALN